MREYYTPPANLTLSLTRQMHAFLFSSCPPSPFIDQALFARQVLVGATTYNTETNLSQWRDIVGDILLHPKYGNNNFDYDFALMKIEAVTLPNLIPVKLSTDRQYPAPNQILTTMGFGNVRSSYTIRPNQLLRKVNITTATYTECKKSYSFDKSSGFCAMAKNKGPCRGT